MQLVTSLLHPLLHNQIRDHNTPLNSVSSSCIELCHPLKSSVYLFLALLFHYQLPCTRNTSVTLFSLPVAYLTRLSQNKLSISISCTFTSFTSQSLNRQRKRNINFGLFGKHCSFTAREPAHYCVKTRSVHLFAFLLFFPISLKETDTIQP